jgi:replicative DNA helicase
MTTFAQIEAFYRQHLPKAELKGGRLSGPCPFCSDKPDAKPGHIVVFLNRDSYFRGLFKCANRCVPAGFHPHFARLMNIAPEKVPGVDPEAEAYATGISYPAKHLGVELTQFASLMGSDQYEYFARFGISKAPLKELKIGFNGRYFVYPYFQESGFAYAAHCRMPDKDEDHFWHGDEAFSKNEFTIYNIQEIERCQEGALFVTEGERNLLILKEMGYPAIAVAQASDLTSFDPQRLSLIQYIFLLVPNSPEARRSARLLATQLGFRARILKWPAGLKRGQDLSHLALQSGDGLKQQLALMLKQSTAFSPFASPQKEKIELLDALEKQKGKQRIGIETGFSQLDQALDGLRGINIMGGPPKAGKSCFFMQISTEVARRNLPVIYYDFENGRQKIYVRTLVRTSRIPEKKLRRGAFNSQEAQIYEKALEQFNRMLARFRVVTDRTLNPEMMRRHIDFIKHESREDDLLIVVDSLHKLPFKDLSERRTGIDSWLRSLEAIRDEQQVCFLVISELSRGKGGGYGEKPDISSFKESGDIEYSADNAMILAPNWDPLDPVSTEKRVSRLWLVASRESSPGKVADYQIDYPYWSFKEL